MHLCGGFEKVRLVRARGCSLSACRNVCSSLDIERTGAAWQEFLGKMDKVWFELRAQQVPVQTRMKRRVLF